MTWNVEFLRSAEQQLEKVGRTWQARILDYIEYRIAELEDPRVRGKRLTAESAGLWRFRLGDYCIICEIVDNEQLLRVVKIGHRRSIYR